ncbi:MAG: DUF2802 domain-containing protein [Cellvibrionaceae bacterium]
MSDLLAAIHNLGVNNVVLSLSGLACIVSFFVLLRGYQRNKALNKKLTRLEHDLRIANSSAIGMGQQLIAMEKQLSEKSITITNASVTASEKSNNTEQLSIPKANATSPHQETSIYDQARQSLAQGLEVGEIAKQCGLSFAEVSLLKSLSKGPITSH